MTSSHNWL